MLGADSLDIYMLSASKEGVIPVSMSYSFIAYSPLIAYMDLDGNVVRTFPIMGKGKTLMDFDSHNFENTAEEFGICYAYAPENGYTVAYNQHYMNYINRDGDPVPTPGYGVLNAEGEWVIEPIYKNARRDYDQPLNDGYISLQNQDGLWGIMNVEGEIVIPFEYYNATPMINGYTLLGKAENDVGVITDSNGQTYTITDSHNNPLEIEALYLTNATNNVRRIETTDGKTYLLSGTPNGTNFKTIWNTENMPLTGHRSPSGEYWLTHTDDGYGVIQVKTVNYIIDDTAQTTAPDSEEKSEEVAEETKETAEETETQPTTNKHFPIRGNSAAKQFRRSSFSGKGLSPMVRH